MRFAYQGVAGAFGEEAALRHASPSDVVVGVPMFEDVFAGLVGGDVDTGIVPIENSLHGSVLDNYDLLLEHDVQIVGEVNLPVRHCLLAPPGRRLKDVTHCWSHPQALAQCGPWLRRHGIEARAASNTAVAARDVAASSEAGVAAVASAHAASIYGLDILAAGIQSRANNTTRFLVLQRERAGDLPGEKASIVFSTENRPGALLGCLERMAERGLNLTKLESRPTGEALGEYNFYADIEALDRSELTGTVIEELVGSLEGRVEFVRLLGRYPRSVSA